jgi:O-antigen ligase
MGVLFPVLLAAVPIIILPHWSFYFDVIPKTVLVLAIAALAIVWAGFWRVPATSTGRRFLALCAAQAAVTVLATVFSTHRPLSFFGSTWRKEGLPEELAILTVAAAAFTFLSGERGRARTFLSVTVIASLPVSLYGIAQYFGVDPWISHAAYHFGEGKFEIVRPPSTLGHAAYFATFLLYPLFAGAAVARREASRVLKTTAIAASGAAGFAILLSGTRAAIVGAIAGALFIALREGVNTSRLRKITAGAAIGLAVLGSFYVSPAGAQLRARVRWSLDDRLGGARLLLWRDTLRMAEGHWMTGYGPETFVVEFPARESLGLAKAYPDFYHESPHNIFFDALVSKGALGLIVLGAWALFGVILARGAIGGAFVAMLVSQQFTAFTVPTELYFYISIAILAARAREPSVERAPHAILRWALAAPLACFAAYLAIGDAMLSSAARALDRNDAAGAARMLDRARSWRATADIYFSRRLLTAHFSDPVARFRAWEDAMEAARSAPTTADDPMNAFVNLASFYAGAGDQANVERSLHASVAAAPNWFKPHSLLARLFALEGRNAEAAAEARAAAERNGGKDPAADSLARP